MDIDDFLTSMQVDELRKREWLDPIHHGDDRFFTVEFEHNGVRHEVENVATPGCVEFFRFLFEQECVRPAFFSSGIRPRNLDLAEKMVRQAFDDPAPLLPNPEKDEDMLTNLILVEEDASYLFPGQEKNMLLCPTYRHPYPYAVNYQGDDIPPAPQDSWRDQFKAANTVFYAAGVLHRVFERLSENTTVPDLLWQASGSTFSSPQNGPMLTVGCPL